MCAVYEEYQHEDHVMVESIDETYYVPECNLQNMVDQLTKLNRRAKKLGVEEITFSHVFSEVRYQVMVCDWSGQTCSEWWPKERLATAKDDMSLRGARVTGAKMPWFEVTVKGKTPKLPGWSLVACLEPLVTEKGPENIIRTVPGKECPSHLAERVGQCDHCNTKRTRTETFVVHHVETDAYKVVGRQCIADFLGGKDPEMIVRIAQWLMSIDELVSDCEEIWEGGGGGYIPRGECTEFLMAVTAAVISEAGWRSKSSCEFGGIPTASEVATCLFPSPFDTPEQSQFRRTILNRVDSEPVHKETASAAIEWAKAISDEKAEHNSYLSNCRVLARTEWISAKHFGIACSIVATYQREMAVLKEQERRAKLPPSQHIGAVKERLTIVVTCDRVSKIDRDFGSVGIHRLVDEAGNVLTWFASETSEWLDAGCKYRVKATVVKHDQYKGHNQTVVNRVSVVDKLNEDGSLKLESLQYGREVYVRATEATHKSQVTIEEKVVNVTKKKQVHRWFWTVAIDGAEVTSGQSDSKCGAQDAANDAVYDWQAAANERASVAS